jgi:1-acyl-sn-glycerol-3-phosphate acyltransferase
MIDAPNALTFSGTHLPFSEINSDGVDQSMVGVFVLYHVKKHKDKEDLVPLYLGYGNIVGELKKLENRLRFLPPEPLVYDYINDPSDPEILLEKLRKQLKPVMN